MSRLPFAALALATTTLAVYACGGSSKGGSLSTAAPTTAAAGAASPPPPPPTGRIVLASGSPLTRAEWIARGDAICRRAKIKSAAISIHSTADYARTLPQFAIYQRIEAQELSKLVPPRPMARDWARIVYGIARNGDYLNTTALYVKRRAYKAAAAPFQKANVLYEGLLKLAGRDGFTECAHARVVNSG